MATDGKGLPWLDDRPTSYSLVVLGAATALVVLFIGASVILAVGHSVPTELWAAASGLSGALVGILAPNSKDAAVNAAASEAGHAAAKRAAAEQPAPVASSARTALLMVDAAPTVVRLRVAADQASAEADEAAKAAESAPPQDQESRGHAKDKALAKHAVLRAAANAAQDAQDSAKDAMKSTTYKVVIAFVVLLLTLGLGIWLTFELGEHQTKVATIRDTAMKDLSGALIALAAAAGGALVGFAAPAPSPPSKK